MPSALPEEPSQTAQLVARIRAGERAAEEAFCRSYVRGIGFLMRRWCRDPELAQDAVQECFRVAIVQLRRGQLRDPAALPGFLRGIARNVLSQMQRNPAWREVGVEAEDLANAAVLDERSGPFETTSLQERQLLVRRLINEMPVARDREVLRRHYLSDEDKGSICHSLSLDADHFDRVLHRARTRLRTLLISTLGAPAASADAP